MARFSDLPDEAVEEIIAWLPPESLKRFKRVCKSWYFNISFLMNNPAFVAKHLHNTKSRLSSSCPFMDFSCLGTMSCPEVPRDTEPKTYYLLTMASTDACTVDDRIPCGADDLKFLACNSFSDCSRVVSQCNGIICCYDYDFHNGKNVIFLLNPALRELKIVPDANLDDDYEIRGLGFGYDSNGNDYKVVTIECEDEFYPDAYKAALYSLRTNSWKEINLNVEIFDFDMHEYQVVYCSGICYWYFWDFGCRILSFDFRDEVFRDIPFPKNAPSLIEPDDSLDKSSKIVVWNGSIALFFYLGLDPLFIDMWVMDSHSSVVKGSCSWTRHLTIGPLIGIKQPVLFGGTEELFVENKDRELISYHLPTKELDNRSICMVSNRVVICEKSLVSVLKEKCIEDHKIQSTSQPRSRSWVNETKKAIHDEMAQKLTQQTWVFSSASGSSNLPPLMVNNEEIVKSLSRTAVFQRQMVVILHNQFPGIEIPICPPRPMSIAPPIEGDDNEEETSKNFDLSTSHSSTSTYHLQQTSIHCDVQQLMSEIADCQRKIVIVFRHLYPRIDIPMTPPPPSLGEDEDEGEEDVIIQKESQQTQVSTSAVELSNLSSHMVTNEEIVKSVVRSSLGNMEEVCPDIKNRIDMCSSRLSTSTYPLQQPLIACDLLRWTNQIIHSLVLMLDALLTPKASSSSVSNASSTT